MTIGHNTDAGRRLRQIVEQIERLEAQKREVADEIKAFYAEAKARGFDPKTIRRVIALRRMPAEQREEELALLDSYMGALGMLRGTPLGDYAERREKEAAA